MDDKQGSRLSRWEGTICSLDQMVLIRADIQPVFAQSIRTPSHDQTQDGWVYYLQFFRILLLPLFFKLKFTQCRTVKAISHG
jgi:hypothetical protein